MVHSEQVAAQDNAHRPTRYSST